MISLLTNGWICYARRTFIRRYILPLEIQIKKVQDLALQILNVSQLNLNLNNITPKNVSLKLTSKNINIKKSSIIHIGVNKCSQDW